MAEEVESLDSRQEFHDARMKVIGATDTPKILGLSRRGSPLTVYNDKVGLTLPGESSLPGWIGLRLQDTVAALYTAQTGQRLRAANQQYRMPGHPWIGCHLDFRAWGKPRLLVEAKTRSYQKGWGAEGSAKIPADVWAQVQHEMLVTGAHQCDVAVLFGLGHDFRVYPILRNERFLAGLVPVLDRYWHDHVLPRVPPEPTGYAGDSAAIQVRYPEATSDLLRAVTPEQEMLVNRLRVARQATAEAQLAQAAVENQIKELIGEGAGLTGTFGTITWKRSKDAISTDWEQVAVARENVIEDLFIIANPGDDPALVARLARAQAVADTAVGLATTVKLGTRRFLVNFKEEE